MYNFKYNPAGYMTKASEVSGKSPFGKPMKMQKMEVCVFVCMYGMDEHRIAPFSIQFAVERKALN